MCINYIGQSDDLHCADFAVDCSGVDGDKLGRLDADFILGKNCVNKTQEAPGTGVRAEATAAHQPQRDVTRSLPLNCADGERRDVERVVTFQLVASPNGAFTALFPHEIH